MKTLDQADEMASQANSVDAAVKIACARIAPTWPLDQFIAVNPYWGYIDEPIQSAASRIERYSGSRMLMPRSFYHEQWSAGSLRIKHLQKALNRSGLPISIDSLLQELRKEPEYLPRIPLLTALADTKRDLLHGMSISDFVTHNVSQHCASYFDHCQSAWETQHKESLYQSWLHHARADMSPWLLMGIHKVRHFAHSLPYNPQTLIEEALRVLPVPSQAWPDYLTGLLMSINGWASWCAYERFQANLSGQHDDHILQLLAIRIAWEQFAFVHLLSSQILPAWTDAWKRFDASLTLTDTRTAFDWIFQDALEISHQEQMHHALAHNAMDSCVKPSNTPDVQAIFCIDVRSELFRRALEAASDSIQTLGFAGFFGLPVSYTPLGSSAGRPQLPGLLSPKLSVSDSTGSKDTDQHLLSKRRQDLGFKSAWKNFRSSAASTFTYVESCGLFYVSSLIKNTLHRASPKVKAGHDQDHAATLRPRLSDDKGKDEASIAGLCDLVSGILTNMSLTAGFARLVLLMGHGSQTLNNPHAAGLDCGACGGQTGEVNARVLAGLLNDPAIRSGLDARGISIPDTTHVLAALHNTTTDEVTIFDTDLLPPSHVSDLARLQTWLQQAGHAARRERAASLGIGDHETTSEKNLLLQFQIRTNDWSQVRPEWGLANNAAFLVAPRMRSRGLNLHGRVFLHEYLSELDHSGRVLESIMTAPMLVTNWINMQYYASTVDNRLYGSGNKVLHNVVGGRLGVFEGNGGDLRIGLPIQSLHDGTTLRHTPLRLSVWIEAPQDSIEAIIARHAVVRNLVYNGWIHLFQITPGTANIARYCCGQWEHMDSVPAV